MNNVVFVRLPHGSLTELYLKLDLAKELGGSVKFMFYRATCRMAIIVDNNECNEFVSVITGLEDDEDSLRFIEFIRKHTLSISKDQIIGLLHPNEWCARKGESVERDLIILNEISTEFSIPIIPLSDTRRELLEVYHNGIHT